MARQNVEAPGGSFTSGPTDFAMRTMGRLRDVRDFNNIVLSYKEGSVVRLEDVARVSDSTEEVRNVTQLNGENAVSLTIRKQSGTNTVEVVDRVLARLERIQAALPSDIKVTPIRDQSRFIRKSFEEIQHHLLLGGILAALVVFLFIRNTRVTIIAALAIPTSIIGTFTVMKALGFTLNNMTMLALSLATGIVIDDAIVVLENIFRYIEEKGVSPREAAIKATGEIGLAVMATTLSLVVIFLPVAFMTGQVGRYFFSFGITSATAILISMFVSFTLTPALCAWWLRPSDAKQGHADAVEAARGLRVDGPASTALMLEWSMAHRGLMLAVAGAVVAVGRASCTPTSARNWCPTTTRASSASTSGCRAARASSGRWSTSAPIEGEIRRRARRRRRGGADQHQRRQRQLLDPAHAARGARAVAADADGRDAAHARQVQERPHQRVGRHRHLGGGQLRRRPRGGGGGSMNRLNMIVQGPDIEQLQRYSNDLLARVKTIKGVTDADTSFETQQPELRVTVDRQRAADIGVPLESVSSSLRTFVGGEEVSKFKDGDEQYSVYHAPRRTVPPGPPGDGRPVHPGQRRPHGPRERRGEADDGERARVDRALQPHAPVSRSTPTSTASRRRSARRSRRPGRRSASWA